MHGRLCHDLAAADRFLRHHFDRRGAGASGALKAIARDAGSTQVTDNGMPLHFHKGDIAPGDTNGHYPGWSTAKP